VVLLKYIPKEYEGETTGMATERALLAPKIASKGQATVEKIIKLISDPEVAGILTDSGIRLDTSLRYATRRFVIVKQYFI
jgi:hypothetical protein